VPVEQVGSLVEAVQIARQAAQPGDVVLLSPGATSYDAYLDFAARGAHFKQIVGQL
jgi:UDP-N-acetylmuramoylalanine--D-glutamate ligase